MPLIKGVDLVPLKGDLNGEGSPFVLRLRCVNGAKIPPHRHTTDENITAQSSPDGGGTYLYSLYGGSPLRKLVSAEEKSSTGRAAYIVGQRAAVMP
jgi:hypothetical protein